MIRAKLQPVIGYWCRHWRTTMDLVDVSRERGGFYVPAYKVKVDGEDLRGAAIAVSQVEADLILGGAGRFSFLVVNSYNDKNRAFLSGRGRRVLDLLRF